MRQGAPPAREGGPTVTSRTVSGKIPIYVFFELTRKCNLRCRHCYIVKEKRPELSTGAIKRVIRQLRDEKTLILNFSGGEILMRSDFFDIAAYARELNFAVKIFTNGTLIDGFVAEKLAKLKPLRVEISIYSVDSKIHDGITGVKGSLEKSLNALRLLREHEIPLRIKTPLMKNNFSGYREIIGLARRLGARYQFDPNIIPKIDGEKSVLRFRIGKRELLKLFQDSDVNANEDPVSGNTAKILGLPCSAGHNSCAINAYGDVQACAILPMKFGNLQCNDFGRIWRQSLELSRLRSIQISDFKTCSRCSFLYYCNRCPGASLLEEKSILEPSQRMCEIAEIRSRVAP